MDHLDYQDIISCAATSTMMLNDTMPLVTHLRTSKMSELDADLTSRYRDAKVVNIFSFLRKNIQLLPEGTGWEHSRQVVPFLPASEKRGNSLVGGPKM